MAHLSLRRVGTFPVTEMREEGRKVLLPTFQRLPPLSDYVGPLGLLVSKH
jgi:hypothetical protein